MIVNPKSVQSLRKPPISHDKKVTIEPPKSFDSMLFSLDEEIFGLLIRCVLDRIPIMIVGVDFDYIHRLAVEIAELVEFRKTKYFGIDFNRYAEYDDLMKEEHQIGCYKRYQFICRSDFLNDAFSMIPSFRSWILCHEYIGEETLIKELFRMHSKAESFLLIHVSYKEKNESEQSHGSTNSSKLLFELDFRVKGKQFNKSLAFESGIKRQIEKSIESPRTAIYRLIKQASTVSIAKSRLSLSEFDRQVRQSLLQQLKGELYNLYTEASAVLPILDFLASKQNEGGIQISDRIPLKLVNKSVASNERILEFMQSEWDKNYALAFLSGNDKLDLIESLWE